MHPFKHQADGLTQLPRGTESSETVRALLPQVRPGELGDCWSCLAEPCTLHLIASDLAEPEKFNGMIFRKLLELPGKFIVLVISCQQLLLGLFVDFVSMASVKLLKGNNAVV